MVTGCFSGFIAVFLLLIENNEAKIAYGSKNCRTGPNNNVGMTVANGKPLIIALSIRQRGMQNRDTVTKMRNETVNQV